MRESLVVSVIQGSDEGSLLITDTHSSSIETHRRFYHLSYFILLRTNCPDLSSGGKTSRCQGNDPIKKYIYIKIVNIHLLLVVMVE